MDSDSEPELISLITQLMSPDGEPAFTHGLMDTYQCSKLIPIITQIISLVISMDLDSQPKPASKLMSVVAQTISLFHSIDLDSQPKPLSELISLISQSSKDADLDPELVSDLVTETLRLQTEPELISIIHQIFSLVVSMNAKWKKLISLCPQFQAYMNDEKFIRYEQVSGNRDKWDCFPLSWRIYRLTEEDATHFHCINCNGRNHEEHDKAQVQIKHSICRHDHSFLLVLLMRYQSSRTRKCYCCDEKLEEVFYYCSDCDYVMNIACVEKPRVLYIEQQPKWHEHKLSLFPRRAFLTCNVCALDDSTSPIYMCPPCDFVVHLRCLKLPRVMRMSRHLHRLSFVPSFFDKGDRSCGVCRKKINNDYGGYSCIRDGCLYAAHSKCATQTNVWDGEELEHVPEEAEEEIEPFIKISDGIIQHFSHQQHHLRLDENTGRDYDEDKQCQACITPIYFGNFYSCMQCDYILHEACANLSRKILQPIHPHLLSLALVERKDGVYATPSCKACRRYYTAGFFYECTKGKECNFELHVQCATISEPLIHGSHMQPLFLTSKPGEERTCFVCEYSAPVFIETFNCIECEFSLCYSCATTPQKVRYKHDKHVLSLSYGEETNTVMNWCELCERKIKPKERFYACDDYCCVTLHIECLIGEDLYIKPGSSFFRFSNTNVHVLPNNHHMSRPICEICNQRCPQKTVFQHSRSILCSMRCLQFLQSQIFVSRCHAKQLLERE